MAKKLETSDLSGYEFEKRILNNERSKNFAFDKIMQTTKNNQYLLFTNFVCVNCSPIEMTIKRIIDISEEIRNIIWNQYCLAKTMNAIYIIHNIAETISTQRNESKVIFIENIDQNWNIKYKEISFKDKEDYLTWFKPLNNACKKDI